MYVTYEEYKALGYDAVGADAFERYEAMAEAVVRRFTGGRISDGEMRPAQDADVEAKHRAALNQRGICELAELYHNRQKAGVDVVSFNNEGYAETYAGPKEAGEAFAAEAAGIVAAYFTAEQRYRGA